MYKSPYSVSLTEKVVKDISEGIDAFVMKVTVGANITVDRDELVKALAYDRGQYDQGYGDGYQDGKRDAWGWISVKERLPEVDVSVLAIAKFKECGGYRTEISSWSGAVNHGVPHFWEFGDAMEVTHWMPLPEPPKEVERDG